MSKQLTCTSFFIAGNIRIAAEETINITKNARRCSAFMASKQQYYAADKTKY